MNGCRWTDWTGHVEAELDDLRARYERVFVGGISMGSLLSLHLAHRYPDVPGVILYSPALIMRSPFIYLTPMLKHLKATKSTTFPYDLRDPNVEARLWGYKEYPMAGAHELLKLIHRVRRLLPEITCPALFVQSTGDLVIHRRAARYGYDRIGSRQKELMIIGNSGHVVTADNQWQAVAERTYQFLAGLAGAPR
jgi:carboxylesterase